MRSQPEAQTGTRTDTAPRPWRPGSATGVGSLPGGDIREAQRLVLDELPDLPHLVELPARGPGAGLVGRGAALLVEMCVETLPSGWRLADRPGVDARRAAAYLRQDLDTLEELTQGYEGPLKVQAAGPWTLAAALELPHRSTAALADSGARRDIAVSLAEGLAAHLAELRRRVPGAEPLLQLDEPALPAVLAGSVRRVSGLGTLAAAEPAVVEEMLRRVVEAAAVPVVVHCCAAGMPFGLVRRAGAAAIGVDAGLLRPTDDEPLADAVDAGLGLFLGMIPATEARPGAEVSEEADTVGRVRALWRRLGFAPEEATRTVVVTPACGLAGASGAYARAALGRARAVARTLADDPEG